MVNAQIAKRGDDSAAASTSPARVKRHNAARLFGYDMFISFALGPSPRGTQSYASDLARRLRERDFTVFFSEDEAAPGEPLTSALRLALHRSRMLVVIANRGTLADPRWVRVEVEEFRATHPNRPVIPISVGGTLQDPALAPDVQNWLNLKDTIWIDETEDAVERGIAREPVVERLALAPTRARSNVSWRWLVRGLAAVLVGLTVASIVAAVIAFRERNEANRQNALAQASRLAAQADLLRERGQTDASVLLVAQAMAILGSIGERSAEIDLSLRRALTSLPHAQGAIDVQSREAWLSSDGAYATTRRDVGSNIGVWQLLTGEYRSCAGLKKEILTANSNGDWCVARGNLESTNRARLEVWSARPLQQVDTVSVERNDRSVDPARLLVELPDLAISDDGGLLAITMSEYSGAGPWFRLWSRSRRENLLRLDGDEFRRFSPDGRHFATAKGLWRLSDEGGKGPVRMLAWKPAREVVFSRDGAYLATRQSYDTVVQLWDVKAARPLRVSKPPEGELLAVRNDGRVLLVAGRVEPPAAPSRPQAVVWDTQTETAREALPVEAKAAAFRSSEPTLLVDGADGLSGARMRALTFPSWRAALAGLELRPGESVVHLTILGDAVQFVVHGEDAIRVSTWNFRSGDERTLLDVPHPGASALSADGRRLAVALREKVNVFTVGDGKPPLEIAYAVPPDARLTSDGSYVAMVANDKVEVRKLDTGESWTSPAFSGELVEFKLSDNGKFGLGVIEGSQETRAGRRYTLLRWRIANPADFVSIPLGPHQMPLAWLCGVSDDGLRIRSGGATFEIAADASYSKSEQDRDCQQFGTPELSLLNEDGQVTVSDARTGATIARLEGQSGVQRSVASADGKYVAIVAGGQIRIFALHAADLVDQVCARVPVPLTSMQWEQYLPGADRDVCDRPRGK